MIKLCVYSLHSHSYNEMFCLGPVCPPSGVARREAGAMPPTPNNWNFYVSIIYKKNTKFVAIRCFFKLKMHQNRFRGAPDPAGGAYDTPPARLPSRLERGTPSPFPSLSTPSESRSRRLDSCPPNEIIVPAPLSKVSKHAIYHREKIIIFTNNNLA